MKLWERALNAASELLLQLLAVYSLIYLAIHGFGLEYLDWLPLALLPLCLLSWVFFTFRRSRLILAAVLLGAAALALWNRGKDFWNQVSESIGVVLTRVSECYAQAYDWVIVELKWKEGDGTLCLLLAGLILALYFSWALNAMRRRPVWALAGSALCFAPIASVHGFPEMLPMAGLLAFWMLLLLSAALRRQQDPAAGPLTLALTPVAALLLTAGLAVLQPMDYQPNPHLHALADRAAELWEDVSSAVYTREDQGPEPTRAPQETSPPAASAAPGDRPDAPEIDPPDWRADQATQDHAGRETSLDLMDLGPLRQSSVNIMRVLSDRSGTTYLRGISMGDYTGTSWEAASLRVSRVGYSAGYAALKAGGEMGHMQVHMLQPSAVSYLPYYYLPPNNNAVMGDASVLLTDEDQEDRDYVFYDGPLSALVPDYVADWMDYFDSRWEMEQYFKRYTQLPDSTRTALLQLAAEAGLTGEGVELIEQVAAYVQSAAVYETEVEPYPNDVDFVLYFLTEAKEGYCVHFATAAAALYRALDIPARLVSGFAFESKANEWVNVSGKDAHAWVEVYLDGVGWVPVEVTGVVGGTDPDDPESEPIKPPVGLAGQSGDKPEPLPDWVKTAAKVLHSVLGLAAAAGLILLRRVLVLRWRAKRFGDPDANRAAVRLRQFARKLEHRGVPFPEALEELAQRACFGQRPVGAEELERCRVQVEAGAKALVDAAPKWKRIWLRFGLCLE